MKMAAHFRPELADILDPRSECSEIEEPVECGLVSDPYPGAKATLGSVRGLYDSSVRLNCILEIILGTVWGVRAPP